MRYLWLGWLGWAGVRRGGMLIIVVCLTILAATSAGHLIGTGVCIVGGATLGFQLGLDLAKDLGAP